MSGIRLFARTDRNATSSILASAVLSLPIGSVAWFELLYLHFGITGESPGGLGTLITAVICFAAAFCLPLYPGGRTADVIRRACRLGIWTALSLPAVAVAVLLLWQRAEAQREDLGMGGLMLYAMPWVALAAAAILCVLFRLIEYFSSRFGGRSPKAD